MSQCVDFKFYSKNTSIKRKVRITKTTTNHRLVEPSLYQFDVQHMANYNDSLDILNQTWS